MENDITLWGLFEAAWSFLQRYPMYLKEYYSFLLCPEWQDLEHGHNNGYRVLVAALHIKQLPLLFCNQT